MTRVESSGPAGKASHARVFVNDRVVDVPEADPKVADVVQKAGYDPTRADCYRLRDGSDKTGTRIPMDTVLHLAGREGPIYLRCVPKPSKEAGGPSILPSSTTTPNVEPRRGLTIEDMRTPTPPPPEPGPEPPAPPGLL